MLLQHWAVFCITILNILLHLYFLSDCKLQLGRATDIFAICVLHKAHRIAHAQCIFYSAEYCQIASLKGSYAPASSIYPTPCINVLKLRYPKCIKPLLVWMKAGTYRSSFRRQEFTAFNKLRLHITSSRGRKAPSWRAMTRDAVSPCLVLLSMATSSSWVRPVTSLPFTWWGQS